MIEPTLFPSVSIMLPVLSSSEEMSVSPASTILPIFSVFVNVVTRLSIISGICFTASPTLLIRLLPSEVIMFHPVSKIFWSCVMTSALM